MIVKKVAAFLPMTRELYAALMHDGDLPGACNEVQGSCRCILIPHPQDQPHRCDPNACGGVWYSEPFRPVIFPGM